MEPAKIKEEKKVIKAKIIDAISNGKNLSYDELKQTHTEALQFIKSLPQSEQGVFYWESGFEILAMMVE